MMHNVCHIKYVLVICMVISCGLSNASAQQPINLWKGIKGGCNKVTLQPYLPSHHSDKKRTAIIVCPGGSYCWLDHTNERSTVGQWLKSEGIAAFVLTYRTQGVPAYIFHNRLFTTHHQYPAMLQDLQQAIRYLREHAAEYNIDTQHIGVMGFSAGGHLAMLSGEFSDTNFLAPLGIQVHVSLKPDFIAAIYPVVTLSDKRYVHHRSRRGLLGEWKKFSNIMRDSLSVEKHVKAGLPPIYLINCKDDPVVKYQNSVLLDSALTAHNVPHYYKQYQSGGHGFGSNPHISSGAFKWKEEFIKWLKCQ